MEERSSSQFSKDHEDKGRRYKIILMHIFLVHISILRPSKLHNIVCGASINQKINILTFELLQQWISCLLFCTPSVNHHHRDSSGLQGRGQCVQGCTLEEQILPRMHPDLIFIGLFSKRISSSFILSLNAPSSPWKCLCMMWERSEAMPIKLALGHTCL